MRKQDDEATVAGEDGSWDDREAMAAVIAEKLIDMETPGFEAEFDPLEAERLGAFREDALTEQDALDSTIDQL